MTTEFEAKSVSTSQSHYKKYKELYIIFFTFLLSGLFGSILTYRLNEMSRMNAKYDSDLQYAREEGKQALEKINELISERHMNANNYITAIQSLSQNDISPTEFETIRSKYLASKDTWNYNWNLMRVKIKNYFSDDLARDFYDYDKDAKADKEKETNRLYWESMSITGKFRALHDAIGAAKTTKAKEDIEMANTIYDSLGYDLYNFFDKMEAMLSSGQLAPITKK